MRTPALLLAFASVPLIAQTSKPPIHRASPAHRSVVAGCAKLPELSPSIPALPAGTPCPRPLFTITRTPDLHADYISPLVSPELRKMLDPPPMVISLIYADEKIGDGPLVEHGKATEVLYTGYLLNGTKFDSSTDPTKPYVFLLGAHHVIAGWDMGLEGMHVGGKRRLFVPYELAYGDNARPPIPPKSMLIFDIEVLKQTDTPPPTAIGPMPQAMPRPMPQPARPATPSPAGAAAPPPVSSTTPAASTQPAQPSSNEPKR